MKHLILLALLQVAMAICASAQTASDDEKAWEITACPVKLLVGAADFKTTYGFIVKTNSTGSVKSVKRIREQPIDKFVDLNLFAKCVDNWILDANDNYFVQLGVATVFAEKANYILIIGKTKKIKLYLDR